jgi:DNA invertase Pin-like site-specific DNA recombinase
VAGAERKLRRCATYTRKSSEEGLEQDFNSLDAQREACEAYIRSQAGEGWKPLQARYDDGGYSGGTLERPGLERLLADIEAGKIDTVVVYKVDRLTRSLVDFAKIVAIFDAHGVSFVSVTQQFNTTTSMGRLTLNMLLSFSQFEREVTGERIRDKIAASKRKGLWMGGYVPLGYEPDGRTLAINEAEAKTVRAVFRLYLELGTVRKVKTEADRLRLTTKVRAGQGKRMGGGRPLSRGYIYHLLGNPLYIGRIAHQGEHHEGRHPPIIDVETWDAVQAQLASQAPPTPRGKLRSKHPSPLRGKLFDEAGIGLTPKHAVKNGKRYRYYVSRKLAAGCDGANLQTVDQAWRLPAREIERIVSEALRNLLADSGELARRARESGVPECRIPELIANVDCWNGQTLELIDRVNLGTNEIAILIDLRELLPGEARIRHTVPTTLRRRGVETRLVIGDSQGASGSSGVDPTLVKAIARGCQWFEDLVTGRARSLVEIARVERVTRRYVGRLLPLAFLAPDIIASVLAGTQPVQLTTEMLTRCADLPLDWEEQRSLLGFEGSDQDPRPSLRSTRGRGPRVTTNPRFS